MQDFEQVSGAEGASAAGGCRVACGQHTNGEGQQSWLALQGLRVEWPARDSREQPLFQEKWALPSSLISLICWLVNFLASG